MWLSRLALTNSMVLLVHCRCRQLVPLCPHTPPLKGVWHTHNGSKRGSSWTRQHVLLRLLYA